MNNVMLRIAKYLCQRHGGVEEKGGAHQVHSMVAVKLSIVDTDGAM